MDYFSGFFLSISFEIFPVINIAYVKIVLGSFIRRMRASFRVYIVFTKIAKLDFNLCKS